MPSQLLVLGDFSGRANRGASPGFESRLLIKVDRDNLDAVMARLRPRLRFSIPGLSEPIEMRFSCMYAFHPDPLWERLPVFAALRGERKRLEQVHAAGELLEPVVAASTPTREDTWARVIRSIVKPHAVPDLDFRPEICLAKVDASTGEVMRAILHHPDFQSLEAAWRSLFLLVSRLETGSLHIVDAAFPDISRDLLTSPDLASTNLHHLLVDEGPWTAVAGLYEFTPSVADAALLRRLGAIATAGGAPFLAAASARFNRLSEAEARAWNTLRESAVAPAIGLVWPRFLLRLPYGANTSSTDLFEFEEMPEHPVHEQYLWGNPAVAALYAIAQGSNELDGLPIHKWRNAEGKFQTQHCGETWLTEEQARRLLELGVTPLVPVEGRDAVRLLN
jgi:type VI secretion system protein ImpC